jgi:long-chain acyl-CoA synthetase
MTDEDFRALGLQPPPARINPPGAPCDVASLIDRAAALHPDAEALDDNRNRYTFRELAHAVSVAAALFERAGIGRGDRIAASLGNEANLVIAFFAAMRLGAIWVGINKILPANDKRYILDHSGTALLITDSSLRAQIDEISANLPALKSTWYLDMADADGGWAAAMVAKTAVEPAVEPARPPVDPFAPAVIMYTSGTTGVPKGVVHSQHNMIVVPAASFAHGLMQPEARRGSCLPLTITNLMILGPVAAFLACKPFVFGVSAKIEPLIEWCRDKRVETIALVPTMVYDLLQADLDLPEGLLLGSGGAPLPEVIRDAFFKRYGYHIATSYGLTEAPTLVAHPMDSVAPAGASGRMLPHLKLSILDNDGKPVPAGSVGEVCFSAIETGPWAYVYTPPLGYWRDAEKTAALLGGGVVHTGDHGSIDAEGWLTIADRSSELILRGGSNVYPAEIERILHTHADVADCAIVGKPDLRMGMLTVACIQTAREGIDSAVLQQDLKALCAENLVRYKVPDEWRFMDSLPRNAMGKVIKPRLRDIVASAD